MRIDRVGIRYGHLVVVAHSHRVVISSRQGCRHYWRCLCDCGSETTVLGDRLASGETKSCGCESSRARLGMVSKKHGHTEALGRSPTYGSWLAMRVRCSPSSKAWKWYGAKGITVCERWESSFENFLADMGERPEGKTLDRIDSDGNYEPSNCRWATPLEQRHNRSASNARVAA